MSVLSCIRPLRWVDSFSVDPLELCVSLLSELIAQLHALIEQHRHTESELQGARDTAGGALAAVQAATVDSSSPLVEQGIGQWHAGLEKLDEASRLLAAGDRSLSDYINGPLLGGSAGATGGVDGGKPVAPLRGQAPNPEPVTANGRRR